MDPPPAPPPQPPPSAQPLSSTPATATTAAYTSTNTAVVAPTTYPDSIDSSPRSRTTDSYFEDPPPPLSSSSSSKLRLMCSYGGHIVPRPHDKSLCYVGGDTRIVVVDRHTSLSSLSSRLANSLLNGRPFTLKYQLPSEDLDSLITVSTDEDLDNMIDEYDRTSTNKNNINGSNCNNVGSSKSSRLRLFLFPLKPDSAQSIPPILEASAKTEDWFLNALNGAGPGLVNRGFSESASVNCLLGLDDDGNNNNGRDAERLNKNAKHQDVHSVSDSPMLETMSSFGSTSSAPSLVNLPPIKVNVEDGGGARGVLQDQKTVGIEDQFAQITVSGSGGAQKQEEGFMVISSLPPPPMPVSIAVPGLPAEKSQVVVGEYQNRAFSDDERSDHGAPVGHRKPPPPQTQLQNLAPLIQQKSSGGSTGGAIDVPSPDSVSSDSSLSNAINRQKPVLYQEPVVQIPSGANMVVANPMDPKIGVSDLNTRVPIQQQVQDSGYVLQPQLDQQLQQQQPQQFIPAAAHYIPHHPAGAVPISFYPVYAPQQQHHHQLDQQYPLYYVQARQRQAYGLPVQQSGISETTTTIPSTLPQTSPNPAMVPPSAAYSALRNAPVTKPEMAPAGMYRTTTTGMPQLVHVPPSQHQQQYVGYSQIHNPSQSVAPPSTGTANYAYELAETAHAQVYYGQPLAATTPSQYQTMTAAAGGALPDASASVPTENIKQQIRTSQPL